jgi:hypothetical protein
MAGGAGDHRVWILRRPLTANIEVRRMTPQVMPPLGARSLRAAAAGSAR